MKIFIRLIVSIYLINNLYVIILGAASNVKVEKIEDFVQKTAILVILITRT